LQKICFDQKGEEKIFYHWRKVFLSQKFKEKKNFLIKIAKNLF